MRRRLLRLCRPGRRRGAPMTHVRIIDRSLHGRQYGCELRRPATGKTEGPAACTLYRDVYVSAPTYMHVWCMIVDDQFLVRSQDKIPVSGSRPGTLARSFTCGGKELRQHVHSL